MVEDQAGGIAAHHDDSAANDLVVQRLGIVRLAQLARGALQAVQLPGRALGLAIDVGMVKGDGRPRREHQGVGLVLVAEGALLVKVDAEGTQQPVFGGDDGHDERGADVLAQKLLAHRAKVVALGYGWDTQRPPLADQQLLQRHVA